MDFALTDPERVHSLTLVGSRPAGYPVDAETYANAALADAALERGDLAEANRIEIDTWVVGHGRSRSTVAADVYHLALEMNLTALTYETNEAAELEPFHDPAALEAMADLNMPLLLR